MTRSAIFSAALIEAAKDYNIVALDIGARNGFDPDLLSISPAVSMIGFEPEPEEASRLEEQGDSRWASVRMVPAAVGSQNRKENLYIPPSKIGASLLQHNQDMLEFFGHEGLHGVDSICEVETVTLDRLLATKQFEKVSFLKIDVEGAELAVLKGGERLLQSTVAIKVEVSFLEQRMKQPLIWDVVEWIRTQDFECMDIVDIHRWRRRPVPAHPYRSRFYMPYSKGRLAQCDLMLFRTPESLTDNNQRIEYILITAALGYFDEAVSILRAFPTLGNWWIERHGFELEGAIIDGSKAFGRKNSWNYLAKKIRLLVPSLRSALFGLPFSKPRRPY